jgi:hypothetical protein
VDHHLPNIDTHHDDACWCDELSEFNSVYHLKADFRRSPALSQLIIDCVKLTGKFDA